MKGVGEPWQAVEPGAMEAFESVQTADGRAAIRQAEMKRLVSSSIKAFWPGHRQSASGSSEKHCDIRNSRQICGLRSFQKPRIRLNVRKIPRHSQ